MAEREFTPVNTYRVPGSVLGIHPLPLCEIIRQQDSETHSRSFQLSECVRGMCVWVWVDVVWSVVLYMYGMCVSAHMCVISQGKNQLDHLGRDLSSQEWQTLLPSFLRRSLSCLLFSVCLFPRDRIPSLLLCSLTLAF